MKEIEEPDFDAIVLEWTREFLRKLLAQNADYSFEPELISSIARGMMLVEYWDAVSCKGDFVVRIDYQDVIGRRVFGHNYSVTLGKKEIKLSYTHFYQEEMGMDYTPGLEEIWPAEYATEKELRQTLRDFEKGFLRGLYKGLECEDNLSSLKVKTSSSD
ncbi:MAG: hypothetical protein RLZZ46_341 [Bacteroidota bacterium]|jgi:hypothetical protein